MCTCSGLIWAVQVVFWGTGPMLSTPSMSTTPRQKASISNCSISDWSRLSQSPQPIGCSHKAAQVPLQYNCKADTYGVCFYPAYAASKLPLDPGPYLLALSPCHVPCLVLSHLGLLEHSPTFSLTHTLCITNISFSVHSFGPASLTSCSLLLTLTCLHHPCSLLPPVQLAPDSVMYS
jgi:hypothetical protein